MKNGDRSELRLENIPYAMNGWRAACLFTNNYGGAQTQGALITVIPRVAPTPMRAASCW